MPEPNRQHEIDRIDWYHEFDFPGGLTARSTQPDTPQHRQIWRFIERGLEKIDLAGKTVLDVGCWDGMWSFYAERRGARSVLATDDLSQNWSTGEGIRLARDLFESDIELRQDLSVYDLASLGRTFDVVLCLGVYYHLVDPLLAFAQIRHCCHPGTVVVLEGDVAIALPPNAALHETGSSRTPAFLPSPGALSNLLSLAYLRVTSQEWSGPHGAVRARLARWRHGHAVARRVLTICAPFEGDNRAHPFAPPFDLGVYDGRFREADPAVSTP